MSDIKNDIIGGGEKQEQAAPLPERTPEGTGTPAASESIPFIETVKYADGISATGVAPLPRTSPEGAPAIEEPAPAADANVPEPPAVDYEALYAAEKSAHDQTKLALADASARLQQASDMGFRAGGGIHTGA